jgi:hypothetical protein
VVGRFSQDARVIDEIRGFSKAWAAGGSPQ